MSAPLLPLDSTRICVLIEALQCRIMERAGELIDDEDRVAVELMAELDHIAERFGYTQRSEDVGPAEKTD